MPVQIPREEARMKDALKLHDRVVELGASAHDGHISSKEILEFKEKLGALNGMCEKDARLAEAIEQARKRQKTMLVSDGRYTAATYRLLDYFVSVEGENRRIINLAKDNSAAARHLHSANTTTMEKPTFEPKLSRGPEKTGPTLDEQYRSAAKTLAFLELKRSDMGAESYKQGVLAFTTLIGELQKRPEYRYLIDSAKERMEDAKTRHSIIEAKLNLSFLMLASESVRKVMLEMDADGGERFERVVTARVYNAIYKELLKECIADLRTELSSVEANLEKSKRISTDRRAAYLARRDERKYISGERTRGADVEIKELTDARKQAEQDKLSISFAIEALTRLDKLV